MSNFTGGNLLYIQWVYESYPAGSNDENARGSERIGTLFCRNKLVCCTCIVFWKSTTCVLLGWRLFFFLADKSNTLFLKVVPPDRGIGPIVHDYDVPVLVSDAVSHAGLMGDLTTRQIVPLIDRVKNVHQISEEVDADPDLVKSCVQNMM